MAQVLGLQLALALVQQLALQLAQVLARLSDWASGWALGLVSEPACTQNFLHWKCSLWHTRGTRWHSLPQWN
jgi:hypothetical protein